MTNHAITVKNLSKRYKRGQQASIQASLYESLSNWMSRKSTATKTKTEDSQFWALRDINFTVNRGESIGIIGHNGAGKSTLLKILSRITDPTHGEIQIAGRVASLLEVGTGFHPELTGLENIYLNGTILGMTRSEIKARLDDIINFSDIADALNTPVKRYSSGMRVRLAFAVAAHLEPEILIVDEVLAVGDMNFQKKCLGKMREAHMDDRTVFFVSHNIAAVQSLCTRCIWLDHGRIHMIGDTNEVIEQYLDTCLNENKTSVNSHPRQSSIYGKKARITEITPQYNGKSGFNLYQDVKLDVTIHAHTPLDNARIRVTFLDVANTPIVTTFSPTDVNMHQGESSTYTITIPNINLTPGKYQTVVAVGYGDHLTLREDLDKVSLCTQVDILPVSTNGQSLGNWEKHLGPITHQNCLLEKQQIASKIAA